MKPIERIKHLKSCRIDTDKDGRVKIDVAVMSKLKAIPDGNYYQEVIIKDKNLMGFRGRVAPGGQRAFVYRYRPRGKDENGKYYEKINKTLGTWYDKNNPEEKDKIGITPAVARKMAEEMRAKIVRGEDPGEIVARRSRGKSLCDISKMWIDNRSKSLKSHKNYESLFNVYIKQNSKKPGHRSLYKLPYMDIVNKAIIDLTKDDYLHFHRAIMKWSKYQSNRVIELIQSVEEYAEETGVIKKRVAYFKKRELFKEKERLDKEDPYTTAELKRYRKATLIKIKEDRERSLVSCFALRGARLIGARSKDQVFSLEWDQVDMDNNKIKYIDTKNDEPMTLFFDYKFRAVLRIMAGVRKTINHRDKRFKYVFPTRFKVRKNKKKNKLVKVKTHHIRDPRKTHASIIKLAKLPYKCIHFLRHSWATIGYGKTGDSKAIQELGGWLDHKSVEKYIKVSEEIKRKRIKEIASNRSHVA
jgi:site-specific recombinase XerD